MPLVKIFDGMGLDLRPFTDANPKAIRVFRHYFREQSLDRDGREVAREVIDALQGYRHPNLYVELYNEVNVEKRFDRWQRYVQLMRVAVKELHNAGIKVAVGSCSTGTPQAGFVDGYTGEDFWLYWKGQNFSDGDAIALHEYWGNQGLSGWNALRYRKVHNHIRNWVEPGLGHPPFIITESGRDAVEGGQAGWKKEVS